MSLECVFTEHLALYEHKWILRMIIYGNVCSVMEDCRFSTRLCSQGNMKGSQNNREWVKIPKKPFFPQIKTKQRYVWTKREATEEGSALGELVDQVSRLTAHQSGSEVLCLLEMCFVHL